MTPSLHSKYRGCDDIELIADILCHSMYEPAISTGNVADITGWYTSRIAKCGIKYTSVTIFSSPRLRRMTKFLCQWPVKCSRLPVGRPIAGRDPSDENVPIWIIRFKTQSTPSMYTADCLQCFRKPGIKWALWISLPRKLHVTYNANHT